MLKQVVNEFPKSESKDTEHRIYFKDSRNMKEIKDNEVHLVVTSPPYWSIKDYGNPKQIGYSDSLTSYMRKLGKVWSECIRVQHQVVDFALT